MDAITAGRTMVMGHPKVTMAVIATIALLLSACGGEDDQEPSAARSGGTDSSGSATHSHDPCDRADREDVGRILGVPVRHAEVGPTECTYFTAVDEYDGQEVGSRTEGIYVRAEVLPYPLDDTLTVDFGEEVRSICESANVSLVDDFLGAEDATGCLIPSPSVHRGPMAVAALFEDASYRLIVIDQGGEWNHERVHKAARDLLRFLRRAPSSEESGSSGALATPDDVAATFTEVSLRMPDEADDDEFSTAVRLLSSRAMSITPAAIVGVDQPEITVRLPEVTDESVVDVLLEDPEVTIAPALNVHRPDAPAEGWAGCPSEVEDGLWVCDPDDGEKSYLIPKSRESAKPTMVTVEGEKIGLNFSAEAAYLLEDLTAEVACEPPEDRTFVLLLGRHVLSAPSLSLQVVCGEGLRGGGIEIRAPSPEAAERLAEQLEAMYPIAPVLQSHRIVEGASP